IRVSPTVRRSQQDMSHYRLKEGVNEGGNGGGRGARIVPTTHECVNEYCLRATNSAFRAGDGLREKHGRADEAERTKSRVALLIRGALDYSAAIKVGIAV